MDVEFIRLEGVVLNGPLMGGLTDFRPEALGHVVDTFLEDARADLARADEWLDSDEPRDGFTVTDAR